MARASSPNDNPATSDTCDFENAAYEEPSWVIKTAEIEHTYEVPQWGNCNMEDASTSSGFKGKMATVEFPNPLFQEMSGQRNFNLYS